jgi:imidazolonepropionase-like amidohydrolase
VKPGSVVLRGRVLPVLGRPVEDGTVVVEDGSVVYAGPAAGAPRVRSAEVEVGSGTVLPGLVDTHVHQVADGAPDFVGAVVGASREVLAERARANAQRALRAGTVAVGDLGAPHGIAIDVGREVAAGRTAGAEVAAAGRALTAPGGHIPYVGVEVRGAQAMARTAREELGRGADGLKLVATGGVLKPAVAVGDAPYDEAELAAAAAVARAEGRWVAAHAIGIAGTQRALRAGATTIEHGVHLDDGSVELMLSTGAVLVATRIALMRMLEHAGQIDPADRAKGAQIARVNVESLRRATRAGVPVAGASDAGTPFNPHGGVAHEAVLLVRDIGLSHQQAVRAVTRTAALCLGRPDLGHLSAGAAGHVVVTAGDPSDDITALLDVRTVVLAGRVVADLEETAGA